MAEHGRTQIVDHGLAHLEGPFDAVAEGELGEEGEGGEGGDAPGEPVHVAAGDGSVDDGPDAPGEHGDLDAAQRHGDEEGDHLAAVGPGETEKPPDQGKGKRRLSALVVVAALAAETLDDLAPDDARYAWHRSALGRVRQVGLVGPVRLRRGRLFQAATSFPDSAKIASR